MRVLLGLCIGYLLGSVLPAELFARARGIDIRAIGTRNPGATNALHQLGVIPGLVTAAYDMSVGLVSMYAAHLLGVSIGWVYLAGVSAVVGHCFPIFSGLKGGQGMAATTGMLLYAMAIALGRGWLTVWGLALLAALAVAVFALTHSATVVGVATAPPLVLEIVLARPDWRFAVFMGGLAAFIWLVQLGIAVRGHLFRAAGPIAERLAHRRSPTHP